MAAVGIGASLYVINRTNEKRNQTKTSSVGSRARCVRVRAVSAPERPPAAAKGEWTPGSWRAREAKQQPTWPDQDVLKVLCVFYVHTMMGKETIPSGVWPFC